jgi:hypothetical protein
MDLHRPLKEAHNTYTHVMGPPYDSVIIKHLRFDCDTTKGALWRFNEPAHLLISRCSVTQRREASNPSDCKTVNAVAWHECVHFQWNQDDILQLAPLLQPARDRLEL